MDQVTCRQHLATLLNQEAGVLDRLGTKLAREHELLLANDIVALEAAMNERQSCVGELLRIEDERRSLLRMLGHSVDITGLERLIAWCDPSGSLKSRWQACAERGARCRELNDRNGALVMARMRRVESLLGGLTGTAPQTRTYSPSGVSSAPQTGRVLTIQA